MRVRALCARKVRTCASFVFRPCRTSTSTSIDMHENSHLGLNSLRHRDGLGDGSFRKVEFRFSGRNQSTCSLMNGYFVGPKTCFDTSIPGVARWMDKGAPGERGEGSANWVVGGNLLEEE